MSKLALIIITMLCYSASAQNPIIQSVYTADPSARVFNGKLYLYPSHDRDSAKWWDMTDWHVFSTKNLKKWKDHGVVLSLSDLKWATKYAWAPDCGYKNGKYYFYYPTDQDYIGVAVGNKPEGPFSDPLGKPLITRQTPGVKNTRDLIDPCIFIDDDGKPYLFFGQLDVCVAELNEDMISLKKEVQVLEGIPRFFEAVWVHKYKGKYYLSYSGKDENKKDRIYYAIADKVLGPYKFAGEILGPVNSGTNHHSIVEYKGKWMLFYHNADLALEKIPEGSPERKYIQWRRSVCAEYLEYDLDGTIKPIVPGKERLSKK